MKKFFFLAVALVASVSMSAQYAHVNMTGFNAETATDAAVGTVLIETAGGNVTIPFTDTWKVVNVKTDEYGWFSGSALNATETTAFNTDTLGLQGQSNGKDADGGNPATTLLPYTSGAALQFAATQDGYLTVFHKGSSNKQYVVFEEGAAIGYEYAQLVKVGEAPEVISYVIEGEGEFNNVTTPIVKVQEIVPVTANGDSISSKNGESAMRFPVYAGATYLFGATGSKMSLLGVYFSTTIDNIYVAKENGVDPLLLLEAAEAPTAVENVEAGKVVKVIENGMVIIEKNGVRYNALGQKL